MLWRLFSARECLKTSLRTALLSMFAWIRSATLWRRPSSLSTPMIPVAEDPTYARRILSLHTRAAPIGFTFWNRPSASTSTLPLHVTGAVLNRLTHQKQKRQFRRQPAQEPTETRDFRLALRQSGAFPVEGKKTGRRERGRERGSWVAGRASRQPLDERAAGPPSISRA